MLLFSDYHAFRSDAVDKNNMISKILEKCTIAREPKNILNYYKTNFVDDFKKAAFRR